MKNKEEEHDDLEIGGVLLGEYLKSSSRWAVIATIAAIIAAVASVITLIITA